MNESVAQTKKGGNKKRNWAFVIYPESLPEDWLDILRMSGLPIAISPLHDKDVNADGTPKDEYVATLVNTGKENNAGDKKDIEFQTKPELTYIELSKTVTGNMAKKDDYFKFTLNSAKEYK